MQGKTLFLNIEQFYPLTTYVIEGKIGKYNLYFDLLGNGRV